jgi:hypothetical protein
MKLRLPILPPHFLAALTRGLVFALAACGLAAEQES